MPPSAAIGGLGQTLLGKVSQKPFLIKLLFKKFSLGPFNCLVASLSPLGRAPRERVKRAIELG
jgi:hypothetical protein